MPAAAEPGDATADTPTSTRRLALVVATAAVILTLDQLSKWWALENLDDGPVDLIWTLRLNLTFNSGAAFSTAGGLGPVIAVVAFVVVGFIFWTGREVRGRTVAITLGMIAGGALGNLADRVFRSNDGWFGGSVVDWIDLQWWPVFNVADASLVVGGILLVLLVGVRGEAA